MKGGTGPPPLERTLSAGSSACKEELRAAFSLFAVKDADGKETLGPDEFARLLRYPGLQTDQVHYEWVGSPPAVDVCNTCQLLMCATRLFIPRHSQLNRLTADKISTVFRGVDLQNTGRITFDAFYVWCCMHEDIGASSNTSMSNLLFLAHMLARPTFCVTSDFNDRSNHFTGPGVVAQLEHIRKVMRGRDFHKVDAVAALFAEAKQIFLTPLPSIFSDAACKC